MSAVRVCGIDDVADGAALRVDIDGVAVSVVRIGDEWFAIGDTCTHADFSLSDGMVWPDTCEIECPKHGAMFSLRTGEPTTLPATVAEPVFVVQVDGSDVFIALDADGGAAG